MQHLLSTRVGRRELLGNFACAFLLPGIAPGNQAVIETAKTTVLLGDSTVELAVTGHSPPGFTYVHVHENEKTSVEAAAQFIQQRRGRLIELKARGTRLVIFRLGGVLYTFDPNRIFTDVGIEKTLRQHGLYSRPAHESVAALRNALIGLVRKDPRLIIAVHNNQEMSVESYSAGHEFEHEAAQVSINLRRSVHDFFLVLDTRHFELLRKAGFNVVLQSADPTDDGSMSVWSAKTGLHYINVEAGYGHVNEQTEMLEAVSQMAGKGQ